MRISTAIARAAAALATLVALVCAAPASAGTYTVHGCKTPAGAVAGLDGWTHPIVGGNSTGANYCGRGSYWIAFMRGRAVHPRGSLNEMVFTAPADTRIRGYTIWRSAAVWENPSFNYAYHLFEGGAIRERCEGGHGCHVLGNPGQPLGRSNRVAATGARSLRSLKLSLGCRSATPCGALTNGDSPAKLHLHRSDIVLEDRTAPVITSRLRERTVAGVWSPSVSAEDRGGGVYQASVEIDGREVARGTLDDNGGRCRPPFTAPQPCKQRASGTLSVDTSQLQDGRHEVVVRVADATGTNVDVQGPVEIKTSNGGCKPRPRVRTARLALSFESGRGGRVVTTGRRGRPTVHGRLANAEGAPVAGASVCLAQRHSAPGARRRSLGTVTTDDDGGFALQLPRGPSRRIYAVYRTGDGAVVGTARVRVRAAVRLGATPRSLRNGGRTVLRGRLLGRPRPKGRALVELQVRRGDDWQTFGTTRTRRRARFRFVYRFTRTHGLRTFTLRALVRKQPGYPFVTGGSRPVRVQVRG